MSNIKNSIGKGSGMIVDSVLDNIITISNYNSLSGSSYIKSPK